MSVTFGVYRIPHLAMNSGTQASEGTARRARRPGATRQRSTGTGLSNIFTQNQYRIVRLDFTQCRGMNAAFTQHFQYQL